jgi:hypothetical protein
MVPIKARNQSNKALFLIFKIQLKHNKLTEIPKIKYYEKSNFIIYGSAI